MHKRTHPRYVADRMVALLLFPLLLGCPGVLPEALSKYDAGLGSNTGSGGMGVGGSGTGGVGMPVPCDAVATLFSSNKQDQCANIGCHNGIFPPDLRGTDTDIWPRLLNQPVGTLSPAMGSCIGGKLVDGTNKAASVMIKRVSGVMDCGPVMPFGSNAPNPAIVECLTNWINAHN